MKDEDGVRILAWCAKGGGRYRDSDLQRFAGEEGDIRNMTIALRSVLALHPKRGVMDYFANLCDVPPGPCETFGMRNPFNVLFLEMAVGHSNTGRVTAP